MTPPCCLPELSCPPVLKPVAVLRSGGEECFCVDGQGLAQGQGFLRTASVDLPLVYTEGTRALPDHLAPLEFLNSGDAFAVVAALVVLVAMLKPQQGLRALAAMVVSVLGGAAVMPFSVVLMLVLSAVMRPNYGQAEMCVALTAVLGFVFTLAGLLHRGFAQRRWVLLVLGTTAVLITALFEARGVPFARAQAALSNMPPTATMPASWQPSH